MRQIGVGIIGIQGIGRRHAETLRQLPNVRIQAACDVNAQSLSSFASELAIPQTFSNYREMLRQSDIDCITIATPHHLHHRMVLDALDSGKHVLCEKPLAIRAADADEMVAHARSCNLTLACHYNFRLAPQIQMLKRAHDAGLLGEVYHVSMRWLARHTSFWFSENTNWRVSKEKAGGGILIGRGSHMIDAVWYILGKPGVLSVNATCSNRLVQQEVEDFSSATIRFENNCVATLECSYVAHMPEEEQRHEYELYGTKGGAIARLKGADQGLFAGRCELPDDTWTDMSSAVASLPPVPGPASVLEDFIQSITDNRRPLVPGEEAAQMTRIIENAYRSAKEKREIFLS